MSYLIRAGDLSGLPVVAIASGEDIAEVRDVVFDSVEHRLIGFTLNKRGMFAGRMKDVLPAEALVAIGADAVMVTDDSAITHSGAPVALDRPGDAEPVIGVRVLSSEGDYLGEVTGVVISTGPQPAAVGYELVSDKSESVFVPISAQLAVSGENLMLPAGATEFVENDLAGFGAAVQSYRAATLKDNQ